MIEFGLKLSKFRPYTPIYLDQVREYLYVLDKKALTRNSESFKSRLVEIFKDMDILSITGVNKDICEYMSNLSHIKGDYYMLTSHVDDSTVKDITILKSYNNIIACLKSYEEHRDMAEVNIYHLKNAEEIFDDFLISHIELKL